MLIGALILCVAASETTLVDLHVDTVHQALAHGRTLRSAKNEVNLKTMAAGDVGAALFAIWVPAKVRDSVAYAERAYAAFQKLVASSGGAVVQARNAAGVHAAWASGSRAALLAIEGAHALGDDPERLRMWKDRGLVAIGLTWQNSNAFAESALDESRNPGEKSAGRQGVGLSAAGERLVRLADELGIGVDLAHASSATLRDVLRVSKAAPLVSHTACRTLCDHHRNLTDDDLRAVGQRGGVVGLTFHSPHLRCKTPGKNAVGRAGIGDVVLQLKRIAATAGVDAVAIGSDYDGMIQTPRGLESAAAFPRLRAALRRAKFTREQLSKLFHGNALRILSRSP